MPGAQFIILGDRADPEDVTLTNRWEQDKRFPLIQTILKNKSLDEIQSIINGTTDENPFVLWKMSSKIFINMANNEDGVTALHVAVIRGNYPVMLELLKRGADVNALMKTKERHYASLHLAIANAPLSPDTTRFSNILTALLTHPSIQCNIRGELGRTPLHTAVFFKQDWAIEQLLKRSDIDVNAATDEFDGKKTPLHFSAFNGDLKTCQKLLEKGADMFARDRLEHAPFHTAFYRGGHPDVAKLLLDQISELSEEQASIVIALMIEILVQESKNREDKTLQATHQLLKEHEVTKTIYPLVQRKALQLKIQMIEEDYRPTSPEASSSSSSSSSMLPSHPTKLLPTSPIPIPPPPPPLPSPVVRPPSNSKPPSTKTPAGSPSPSSSTPPQFLGCH